MTERIGVLHSQATADIVLGALVESEAVPYIVPGSSTSRLPVGVTRCA